MRLDPVSLKLFVAVVEQGSITAAAESCHIAAAAVSKRVSELESLLATPLLRRTNKGVEATPAGLVLLGHARRVLRDLDEIAVELRQWSSGTRGQVRVVANISAIAQFLPRELAAFLADFPGVQIRLQERISSAIVKAVADNEADVGVGVIAPGTPGIEVFRYLRDELAVVVPSGHPLAGRPSVAFADTLASDYVGLHSGSTINMLMERAALDAGRPLRLRIEVTSFGAVARMVEAGLGVGLMPRAVALPYAASLAVQAVALEDAWRVRELGVCVRAYDALPVAARMLVDRLRERSEAL